MQKDDSLALACEDPSLPWSERQGTRGTRGTEETHEGEGRAPGVHTAVAGGRRGVSRGTQRAATECWG